jgi:hypothetical protein
MNYKIVCWTARIIIVLNWLAMALILAAPHVHKNLALSAFVVFRACALCGLAYLFYESSLVTEKHARVAVWIADALLVLPMFAFWFAVRAATF